MIYGLDYYENMLRRYSLTAERISKLRWEFIRKLDPKIVLDYGSGVGWFRAFRPSNIDVDSFDIGDYPQTGICHSKYDVVCLWDVLEHLKSLSEVEDILQSTRYVALTTPIKPKGVDWNSWKHFKPGEHLQYFSVPLLKRAFGKYGFKMVESGYVECPPREDILSAIFQRMEE
jgi:hypothetical protein